jgi:membrane protease YdiL (CAAX protease family)
MPLWVHAVVAFVIAAVAFGLAHIMPGAGMMAVVLGTTLWTVWSMGRARRRAGAPSARLD